MASATNIRLGAIVTDFIVGMRTATASVGPLINQLNRNLVAAYSAADREQRVFDRGLGRLGSNMVSFGKQALIATAGIALLASQSFSAYAEINALQLGLESAAGTAGVAKAQFTELREVSKLPGLGLEEAVKGALRLEAINFSAKEARDTLLQFGNAVALSGGGKNELDRITTQLSQMAGKGKVLSQDLRPILEASPKVAAVVAKMFGTVNAEDISAKLEATGRSSKDFISDLVANLAQLERVKGGPKNAMENFADSVKLAQFTFGEAADKALDLTGSINNLGDFVGEAADGFSKMNPALQVTTLGLIGAAAAVGPLAFGIGSLIKLGPTFVDGFKAMKTAMLALASPVGLVVAAAAAVVGATYAVVQFNTATKSSFDSARSLAAANTAVASSVATETGQLTALLAVAKDEKLTKDARKNAIDQINKIAPQYLNGITLETINTEKATKAVKDYTRSIELKATAEYNATKLAEAQDRLRKETDTKPQDRIGFSDRLGAALSNTFTGKGFDKAFNDALTGKGVERQNIAISDAQKYVELYRKALEGTTAEMAKLGIATPGTFDYKGATNGAKDLKVQLRETEKAIRSIVDAKGKDAVPPELITRAKELRAEIKAAKDLTNPPTSKTFFEQETERLKGMRAEIERLSLKGLKIPDKLLKDTEELSRNLKTAADAAAGLKTDLPDVKPIPNDPLPKLPKAEAELGGFTGPFKGQKALPGGVDLLAQMAEDGKEKAREVAQNLKDVKDAYNTLPGFFKTLLKPSVEGADDIADGIGTSIQKIIIKSSEIFKGLKQQLAQDVTGVFSAIGESIGSGSADPFKSALKTIIDSIAAALIQLGSAMLLASEILAPLVAVPFAGAAVAPLSIGQGLVGAGLLVAGGALKGIGATAFAQGGIVRGPRLGLVGEYPGVSTNPEIISPLNKLTGHIEKAMLNVLGKQSAPQAAAQSAGGTLTHRIDLDIRGSDLRTIQRREDARNKRVGRK